MKPLPLLICRNGVFYHQIKRTADTAIYALRYSAEGRIIGFDLFRVHREGQKLLRGKTIPAHERFPWNQEYGTSAWSYTTEAEALRKFASLVEPKK
jgi:hypothetical protein